MPYRYDPVRPNPYAGTIGDLILRQGDIAAQGARSVGNAQADSAREIGAIHAGAARNIGAAISGTLGDIAQYSADAPRRQLAALQVAGATQAAQDDQLLRQALTMQPEQAMAFLQSKGPAGAMALQKITALKQQQDDKHNQITTQIGLKLHDSGNTLEAMQDALNTAEKNGLLTSEQAQAMGAAVSADPSKIPLVAKGWIGATKEGQALLNKTTTVAPGAKVFGFDGPVPGMETPATPKTRTVTTIGADGKPVTRIVEDTPGQDFPVPPPQPPAAKKYQVTVPGPNGQPISKLVTEEELAGGMQVYREPKAAPASKAGIWIMRDGQTLRVQEEDIRVGDKPANTREQGRPVTSGDAGRLADMDTSLGLLEGLGTKLGTTGAGSKIGAILPNVVTEYTGWGADSKSRQATIDTVKQIIGKALEGGVLRKEDEIKYEKILPQIGDPPTVAKAKIDGLKQAIADKKQNLLDNLESANYDVSKFNARGDGGLLEAGNIDLSNRPRVKNSDGSISTVRSMSINEDGKEILIPTVVNGRVVSEKEAIDAYHKTGQHLGIFKTEAAATAYAQKLHESEAGKLAAPRINDERTNNGVTAVWKNGPQGLGWYKKS